MEPGESSLVEKTKFELTALLKNSVIPWVLNPSQATMLTKYDGTVFLANEVALRDKNTTYIVSIEYGGYLIKGENWWDVENCDIFISKHRSTYSGVPIQEGGLLLLSKTGGLTHLSNPNTDIHVWDTLLNITQELSNLIS